MLLYHGSNAEVSEPEIRRLRTMDFGYGFYTTTNEEQAKLFAPKVVRRERKFGNPPGAATVNVYEFDMCPNKEGVSIRRFDFPDAEWLDYVVGNRQGVGSESDYDIIIGPVANDDVYEAIGLYIDGTLTRDRAIVALKIKSLFDQFVFKTDAALKMLRFRSSYRV